MKKTLYLFMTLFALSLFSANAQVNLITNGNFENGISEWQNLAGGGGVANFSIETNDVNNGSGALRSEITTIGENAWDVQSIHSGWASESGKPYTLTFYAKSVGTNAQVRIVQQSNTYAARDFALSTEWQQYTWEFEAGEDNLQLKIHYFQAGTFLFDDFFIAGESNSDEPIISFVDPKQTYQEMVGFGGALAWHCDRVTRSSKRDELYDLFFEDLGIDILRLKNWYYPAGYPANKTANTMEVEWFKPHFDATAELFEAAKSYNADIEVLLSSWGPPSSLKSNDALNEGTLKKNNNGQFMYEEFAEYWEDILNNVGFNPDYISIQNEPGYENANWTTCGWRPTETNDHPSFSTAMDITYNRIKDRPSLPKMIAPETENIGGAVWDQSINTFSSMTNTLANKDYLYAYAYHIYNYYNSPNSIATNLLNMIRDDYNDKPNFMTEFSSTNYNWLQTANVIHTTVTEANASAYIFWELMWDETSQQAMVKVDGSGDYEITDQYYAVKHFAKFVNKGYKRIQSSGSTNLLKISSYLNPAGNQVTHVIVNRGEERSLDLSYDGYTILALDKYESVAGNYFQNTAATVGEAVVIPAQSIVTIVADIEDDLVSNTTTTTAYKNNTVLYPNPADDVVNIQTSGAVTSWVLSNSVGVEVMRGSGKTIEVEGLQSGIYFITTEGTENNVFRFVKR